MMTEMSLKKIEDTETVMDSSFDEIRRENIESYFINNIYEKNISIFNNPDFTSLNQTDLPIYRWTSYRNMFVKHERNYECEKVKHQRNRLAMKLAEMESGMGGFAFSSGKAAINSLFSLFSIGDNIIIPDNLCGWALQTTADAFKRYRLSYRKVDITNYDMIEKAFSENAKEGGTAAIFIETPSFPFMDVTDISMVSHIAKKYKALVIVDNTIMTPYLQKPLAHGADIVLHRNIGYICPESSVRGGLIVVEDNNLSVMVKTAQKITRDYLSPTDTYVLLQSINSLGIRIEKNDKCGARVSNYLMGNPIIKKVYYPGDQSSRNYQIQLRQASGFGGMISFVVDKSVNPELFLASLKLIRVGGERNGNISRIIQPTVMKHSDLTVRDKQRMLSSKELFQIWVGREEPDDIIADLDTALKAAQR